MKPALVAVGVTAAVAAVGLTVVLVMDDGPSVTVEVVTEPAGATGEFLFTGVPSCPPVGEGDDQQYPPCLPPGQPLTATGLQTGTYTTTMFDPAPDFDIVGVACDDGDSATASLGDPTTRSAVFNVDPGEDVTCTYTVHRRGSVTVEVVTEPAGATGEFLFTGVPSCPPVGEGDDQQYPPCLPPGQPLTATGLQTGTYTTTMFDPAPDFDIVGVACDDGDSATASLGDPTTRSAVFNVDPGEDVTCTYTVHRRGSVTVEVVTEPAGATGEFLFTGVPSCPPVGEGDDQQYPPCLPPGQPLTATGLQTGTYTTTMFDPAPDFDIVGVACDDGDSATASLGDPTTRSAVFNVDPGEDVTCTYTLDASGLVGRSPRATGSAGSGGTSDGGTGDDDGAVDPFVTPDADFDDLPAPAGDVDPQPQLVPREGPWVARNGPLDFDCGGISFPVPAGVPDFGSIEVLDGGATLIGTPVDPAGSPVTMTRNPSILGRYVGSTSVSDGGATMTIDVLWQVVTDEYVIGNLTSSFSGGGVTCSIYRPYELRYTG